MNSNASSWYFLLLITFLHIGGIAFVVSATEPLQQQIIEPTIQGVLINPEKKEATPVPPKPKPKPKPKHKHKHKHKPPPKAPPSEHAVKAPEPEPIPVEEPKEPVEEPLEPVPEPVVLPSADAEELNNSAPVYPAISKKLKEEGTVLLLILVTKEGFVAEIEIKNGSGYKRLDDAAVRTIKRWKFNPATQAGEAIDYWYEIPIEFSLRKK